MSLLFDCLYRYNLWVLPEHPPNASSATATTPTLAMLPAQGFHLQLSQGSVETLIGTAGLNCGVSSRHAWYPCAVCLPAGQWSRVQNRQFCPARSEWSPSSGPIVAGCFISWTELPQGGSSQCFQMRIPRRQHAWSPNPRTCAGVGRACLGGCCPNAHMRACNRMKQPNGWNSLLL